VKEGAANRWFRRFAEGRFDLADVERRAGDLAAWLPAALAAQGLAGREVMGLGFSNGANIAHSLLLRHAGLLAGAVLLRAQHVLDATGPTASGARVLLVSGALDPIVPAPEAARLADALRLAGAAVEQRVLPAGHGLVQQDLALAQAFLAR
jgi:phospholipase/carboxylesterase